MQFVTLTLNNQGEIKDVDFAAWIVNEIEDTAFTRKDVAATYAILIEKRHQDWKPINEAILKRWSKSGLLWIKTEAWKQVQCIAPKAV